MSRIQLLDCTLRDGGYVNDWKFGHDNLISILERTVTSGTDIIEIGFLDDRRPFDMDRSIMPDTDSVRKIYGDVSPEHAMIVGMIDYGTCAIEHLTPCSESYLDGIRVIFKKHIMHEAIDFCKQVKALGYRVFTQAVSITSYSDKEFLQLIDLVNELEPFALSVVDTYGLLHQNHLMHYIELMDYNLKPTISMGYHSHNNFQLGYSNCIEFMNYKTDRKIVVDGTLYGMGKSAGNTPIELLAMYLNNNFSQKYDVSQMLEAIDSNIMNIYSQHPWGYNMFYYIAASNDCHPNYVQYLMDKHTLSVKSINEILQKLEGEKKLLYDKQYIEYLYDQYQKQDLDDSQAIQSLSEILRDRKVLVLGPGKKLIGQKEKIHKFIQDNDPVVISINFVPSDISVDYLFLSNSKRYVQLSTQLSVNHEALPVIATSNVTSTKGEFSFSLDYSSLLDTGAEIPDNSFVMFMKAMVRINVPHIFAAGFDGYSLTSGHNYFKPSMEYPFNKSSAENVNNQVKQNLKEMQDKLTVEFITDSLYISEE